MYPAALLAMAVVTLVAAWVLSPGPDEFCYLPGGIQFGGECGMVQVMGVPCPQCGMTRSFVHAARLNLVSAFWYNPAGLALFLWIQVAGFIGLVRLVTRTPRRLEPPIQVFAGWAFFWLIALYALPYALRVFFDVNPLPL